MKKVVLLFALILATLSASAQFRLGVKGGLNLNRIHFDEEALNVSKDQIGYTGGVTCELEFGQSGFALDCSVMYTHRQSQDYDGETIKRDYISIPVNLKFKLPMGPVRNYFAPFIFTGPEWATNVNDRDEYYDRYGYRVSRYDIAWNVGAGVEIARHLQLSANYGLSMSNGLKRAFNSYNSGNIYNGKDHCWTFTATVLF